MDQDRNESRIDLSTRLWFAANVEGANEEIANFDGEFLSDIVMRLHQEGYTNPENIEMIVFIGSPPEEFQKDFPIPKDIFTRYEGGRLRLCWPHEVPRQWLLEPPLCFIAYDTETQFSVSAPTLRQLVKQLHASGYSKLQGNRIRDDVFFVLAQYPGNQPDVYHFLPVFRDRYASLSWDSEVSQMEDEDTDDDFEAVRPGNSILNEVALLAVEDVPVSWLLPYWLILDAGEWLRFVEKNDLNSLSDAGGV